MQHPHMFPVAPLRQSVVGGGFAGDHESFSNKSPVASICILKTMKPLIRLLVLCTALCSQVLTIGAAQSVEVLRDPWGVPHVFAGAETDGFFGLGWAAAEDRLLQMELIRRKAAGRLVEVFGADWVDADREARITGHAAYAPRALAKLPERWRQALSVYAAGVNAWREANGEAVARRFKPLGILPEAWTPADCLFAARGILSLGSPFSAGPVEAYHRFQDLVAQVGEAEAARQTGMSIDDSSAIVSEAEMAKDKGGYERLKRCPRMPGFTLRPAVGEEPLKMSHTWAVGGGKSTTGKPILESDPQLPLSSPPFFHEFHLAAGRIDAQGLGIPAIPAVIASTNAAAKPLPGRKPDDPRLEEAFRVILRQGTAPEEVDAKMSECRDYVKGNAGLTEQLRSATVLGVYLIEESAAGRLKVPYGSPHALEGFKKLLTELEGSAVPSRIRSERGPMEHPSKSSSAEAGDQSEVWLCAGERIADLLRPDAAWPFVKAHLTGLKLYIDQIDNAAPEQLAALVRLVKEHHFQVAVELGGCLDFAPMDDTAGEWSARLELAKLEKFYAAGGQVDFLDVDGPIRRLMHPEERRDGKRFDSIEKAADELVDALRLHQAAHPKTRFWLLSNFPNWGWRGDVSYHARGPRRQDYGDDYEAVQIVLRKLGSAGIPLAGITVDNPYEYLIGEHSSVSLKDPKSVDWLKRVRSYEDFARERGLEFNLIVNSERGGQESDERFYRETLQMVDIYRKAGGRPARWLVQSWYPHPKQIEPETAPHSMTALVKAAIEKVQAGAAKNDEAAPLQRRQAMTVTDRIVLQPQAGAMQVTARMPGLDNQAFSLGMPETIGCREAMLVNFPEAKLTGRGRTTPASFPAPGDREGAFPIRCGSFRRGILSISK